jgi:hypothetical protein
MDQLDALVIQHVVPEALRINREPRLNSRALHEPAIEEDLVFIPSGQPWRNGVMAYLTAASGPNVSVSYIFLPPVHSKGIFGAWKKYYNTIRQHSSLGTWPQRIRPNFAPIKKLMTIPPKLDLKHEEQATSMKVITNRENHTFG